MRRALILPFLLALMCVACGDEDHFRVKGTVDGNATMNVRVGYYSDGAYHTILTAARDGVFEFQGSAPAGAVVDLYDHEYRLIGRFYGRNGTDYELGVVRINPYAMTVKADGKGAEISDRLTGFLTSNADSLTTHPNGPVGRYVRENPADIVSTFLLTTVYDAYSDPVGADSLLTHIDPSARPSSLTAGFQELLQRVLGAYPPADTIPYRTRAAGRDTFYLAKAPVSLFVADNRHLERDRALLPFLKSVRKEYPHTRLQILEVSLDNDTTEWKRATVMDSATWIQTWTPGAMSGPVATRLGIERLPHFLVADSAGTVLYRGSSIQEVKEVLNKTLKK